MVASNDPFTDEMLDRWLAGRDFEELLAIAFVLSGPARLRDGLKRLAQAVRQARGED